MIETLYYIFIYPMQTLLGAVFEWLYAITHSYGLAIVLLSLCVNVFLLKLTHLSESKARAVSALKSACDKKIAEFKKVFRGAELHAYTQILFKQKHYHPIYNLFSLSGLALQIPFFLGVLFLLQDFEGLQGARFGVIEDLSKPDTLLFGYALLPFVMSILSLISVFVSVRELGARVQGSLIALIFLVLLYVMPSGLVLYWSVSMAFSLIRTLLRNSSLAQSLNDFGGSARSFMSNKLPSPRLEKHLNLAQDTRISGKSSAESNVLDSAIFAQQKSNNIDSVCGMHPLKASSGVWGVERGDKGSDFRARGKATRPYLHIQAPLSPLEKTQDSKNLKNIRENATLGNKKTQNTDSPKSAQEANLLSRFKNVLHAIFTPHKDLDSKTYLTYRNISIFALLNIFFLIFVFSPFAVYSSDVSQFDPSQTFQTLGGLFGFFLLFSFLGIYTTSFFYHTRLLKLGAYGDYGSMNHFVLEKANFIKNNSIHRTQRIIESVLPSVFIVFIVVFLIKRLKIVWKITFVTLCIVTSVYFGSIVVAKSKITQTNQQIFTSVPYQKELFSYAKEAKNVVVIFLDAFSGSHTPHIFEQFPELKEALDGFVLFPQTLSTTNSTSHSIATLIGGEYYTTYNMNARKDILYESIIEAYGHTAAAFTNHGYDVSLFMSELADSASAINAYADDRAFIVFDNRIFHSYYLDSIHLNNIINNNKNEMVLLINVGAFRFAPDILRKYIYNDSAWLGGDIRTRNTMISTSYIAGLYALTHVGDTESTKPTFKFFHSLATHAPYGMYYHDHKCEFFSSHTAWNDYEHQVEMGYPSQADQQIHYQHYDTEACSLSYISDYIKWLKDSGIYDNTQIFIVSDHGSSDGINVLSSRADALLLFKDFNSRGVLKVDSRLMQNYDIVSIFCENLPQGCPKVGASILKNYPKNREIIHTVPSSWMLVAHKKNRWILSRLYRIRDNIFDPKNWVEISEEEAVEIAKSNNTTPKEH